MSSDSPLPSMALDFVRLGSMLLLATALPFGNARGAGPQANKDITIQSCPMPPAGGPNCPAGTRCFAAKYPPLIPANSINEDIVVFNDDNSPPSGVSWTFNNSSGVVACNTTTSPFNCAGMDVSVPGLDPTKVHIGNSNSISSTGLSAFSLTVTDSHGRCDNVPYVIHVTADGGGWGDPHITTVDGIHYDFQSAGEFTALRGNGLEIQTRQTPIASASVPGASAYSGLQTCVAIYSAVAARVGEHRVSYQPNIGGDPDPSGLQLRVDGVLTRLGPEGIDLRSGPDVKPATGGRIVRSAMGGGIEIHYVDGTQLVVTPAWWPDQQTWYLNVNVYGTTATLGTFGKLPRDSWLPALPDGGSFGPKPTSLHERYTEIFGKFADAWRVTDKTSLFDYKPGTSTATFTLAEWPRENPTTCAVRGQPSAKPVSGGVARKACAGVTDKKLNTDCIFDVSVTGNTGFANTYKITQQLRPDVTATTLRGDKDRSRKGESVTFTATVAQKVSRGGGAPSGAVLFVLDGRKAVDPVTLDAEGRALWTTSGLPAGRHEILARYVPAGWGGFFTASSAETSHWVFGRDRGGDHDK